MLTSCVHYFYSTFNWVWVPTITHTLLTSCVHYLFLTLLSLISCCKVRGDLVAALKRLYQKVETFDGIIIETTGLADPAPVVQTFFAETNDGEEALEKMYKLDSIITVTDAKYILERLDEERADGADNEAEQQVCFADKIILNKMDLINNDFTKIDEIEKRLRSLNTTAPILRCEQSNISPSELLNIGAFDLENILKSDPFFLGEIKTPKHDKGISSISVKVASEVNLQMLQRWISCLLRDEGETLYRYKGIIAVKGATCKFVFQGVGHFFNADEGEEWKEGEERTSTFVFIGKNLDTAKLKAGFNACIQSDVLRFEVGTRVECNLGREYAGGEVIATWDNGNAYRVMLDKGHDVWAPIDIDMYIRRQV